MRQAPSAPCASLISYSRVQEKSAATAREVARTIYEGGGSRNQRTVPTHVVHRAFIARHTHHSPGNPQRTSHATHCAIRATAHHHPSAPSTARHTPVRRNICPPRLRLTRRTMSAQHARMKRARTPARAICRKAHATRRPTSRQHATRHAYAFRAAPPYPCDTPSIALHPRERHRTRAPPALSVGQPGNTLRDFRTARHTSCRAPLRAVPPPAAPAPSTARPCSTLRNFPTAHHTSRLPLPRSTQHATARTPRSRNPHHASPAQHATRRLYGRHVVCAARDTPPCAAARAARTCRIRAARTARVYPPPHATRHTLAPPSASHRAPHATRTPYAHAASRRSRDTPHATRTPAPPAQHAPRALPTPPARATRARARKPPAPSRSAQWTPRRRQG